MSVRMKVHGNDKCIVGRDVIDPAVELVVMIKVLWRTPRCVRYSVISAVAIATKCSIDLRMYYTSPAYEMHFKLNCVLDGVIAP